VSIAEDIYPEALQDETEEDTFTITVEVKSVHTIESLLSVIQYTTP